MTEHGVVGTRETSKDDKGAPPEHAEPSSERLEAWLDAALEDTFPASDPIASPPSGSAGDR